MLGVKPELNFSKMPLWILKKKFQIRLGVVFKMNTPQKTRSFLEKNDPKNPQKPPFFE